MKILVTISQTKDDKYRAACQSLPGCVITAESYEDAETRIQREVEGYMASLNVANAVKLEIDRSMQWSEAAAPIPGEVT
jgi:predicted RNase H-like HicB family nuclease